MDNFFRKQFGSSLTKLSVHLSHDPAITFPGIYLREMKKCSQKYVSWTFICTLVIITPNWKHPNCPTVMSGLIN